MSNIVETSNVLLKRKNEIAKSMAEIKLYPTVVKESVNVAQYSKFPISRLAAFGTAFKPVVATFQYVLSGGKATSGLYMVTIPNGGELAHFSNIKAYLGSVLKSNGAVGGGQARLNPLVFDPTTLFMAIALANIDKKLDTIQEMQQELDRKSVV